MAKKTKDDLEEPGLTDATSGKSGSRWMDSSLGSAPSAAEAEKAVAKAMAAEKTAVPEVPAEPKPTVPIRVFQQVSGVKPAEFRAFAVYAAREDMRPCSIPEWRERYATFCAMPTAKMQRFRPAR